MTERSHPSWLPPRFKKSRSRSVEREKKKSKNSRSSRSLFKSRTFSGASSHCALLVSHSVISLPNIFFRLTSLYFYECGFCLDHERKSSKDCFLFILVSGRCLASFSAEQKIFLSFPLLSLSLSLSFDYIYIHIREEVKEVLFKTGGGRLEESLFFSFDRRRRRKFAHHRKLN